MKLGFCTLLAAILLAALSPVAHAAPQNFVAFLSGPAESPPNGSLGNGAAYISIDSILHTLSIQVNFSGLSSNDTAAHIHAATASPGTGTAGVATVPPAFPGFPLGVTSGTYSGVLNTSTTAPFNGSFVTANGGTAASAEAALFASIAAGTSYLNIHTVSNGGGEIRGFLVAAVPLPPAFEAGLVLLGGLMASRLWRGGAAKARD